MGRPRRRSLPIIPSGDRSVLARRSSAAGIIGVLAIFGFTANLPFVTQAFHIDDRLNIYLARQILASPFDPYGFVMVFYGQLRNFHEFYANPPLGGYLLALPLAILGESEIGLHLAYTVFTLLAGLFMYLLARRFRLTEWEAASGAALLLISPGVFTMGHTVMPDVALLSFYTAAVYFFVGGVESGRIREYALGGVFAAAASLTRYSGLTLVPIFLGFALLRERKVRPQAWISVVLPLLATLVWLWCASSLYGGGFWEKIFSMEVGGGGVFKFVRQVVANLTHLGGASVFPPALLYVLKVIPPKTRSIVIGIASALCLVCAGVFATMFDHTAGQIALFLVFGVSILSFLGLLVRRARAWLGSDPGRFFLMGWLFLLVLFNASFLHTAVKYNILEMPALVVLFLLMLREAAGKPDRKYLVTAVALTGILGVTTAVGDGQLANAYREFAQNASAHRHGGNKVFYLGDWGWEHYMSRQGARPVLTSGMTEFEPGDVILSPTIAWPQPLPAALKGKLILKNVVDVDGPFPVRTMNGAAKAFFYGNLLPGSTGVLPWAFSTAPLETFYVVEVH